MYNRHAEDQRRLARVYKCYRCSWLPIVLYDDRTQHYERCSPRGYRKLRRFYKKISSRAVRRQWKNREDPIQEKSSYKRCFELWWSLW